MEMGAVSGRKAGDVAQRVDSPPAVPPELVYGTVQGVGSAQAAR